MANGTTSYARMQTRECKCYLLTRPYRDNYPHEWRSDYRNNSAGFNAGGIFNAGTLTLLSSSVISNIINTPPPGLVTASGILGGGAITNCTIANNPGGQAAIVGIVAIRSTTVFGNAGFG